MFTCGSLRHGDMNDVIYEADGTREGLYGYTRGPLWVYMSADMGSREGRYGFT